jgi:hypothetical protein
MKRDIKAQSYTDKYLRKLLSMSIDVVIFMKNFKIHEISEVVYNAEKDEFQYNKTLSSLSSISLDADKKQLISTEEKDGKKVYVIYEWKDGTLEKLETKTKAPEAVKDNVLGSTSSNNTTARPDKNQGTSNNGGLSGVIVPGATKPQGSSGGIVIATENKNDVWY